MKSRYTITRVKKLWEKVLWNISVLLSMDMNIEDSATIKISRSGMSEPIIIEGYKPFS
jgi:hypothetical protein